MPYLLFTSFREYLPVIKCLFWFLKDYKDSMSFKSTREFFDHEACKHVFTFQHRCTDRSVSRAAQAAAGAVAPHTLHKQNKLNVKNMETAGAVSM